MEAKGFSIEGARVYAKEVSKTVVIRSYNYSGSSIDTSREATEAESQLLEIAIMAALAAIGSGQRMQSAIDTAENFIVYSHVYYNENGTESINTYDSVCRPIKRFLETK